MLVFFFFCCFVSFDYFSFLLDKIDGDEGLDTHVTCVKRKRLCCVADPVIIILHISLLNFFFICHHVINQNPPLIITTIIPVTSVTMSTSWSIRNTFFGFTHIPVNFDATTVNRTTIGHFIEKILCVAAFLEFEKAVTFILASKTVHG